MTIFVISQTQHPQEQSRSRPRPTVSGARKGRGANRRHGSREKRTRRVAQSGRISRSWRKRMRWKVRMMSATPRAGFMTIRTMAMMSITTMSITRIARRPMRERTNTHNTMTRVTIPLRIMGATGLKALKPLARPLTKIKERMMSPGLMTPRNVRRVSSQ